MQMSYSSSAHPEWGEERPRMSQKPTNPSCPPGNSGLGSDMPHYGERPHFSISEKKASDEEKMYSHKSSASGGMQEDISSRFSVASSCSPGKPLSSPRKAYPSTGNFLYHGDKELTRTFQAKNLTSFSSNGQILTTDKERNEVTGYSSRDRGFGFFGNLPRGPRGNRRSGDSSSSSSSSSSNPLVNRDRYNLPDFEIKYEHAKFFVIKSFNEEDIHKSIKYNVWSSTLHGNMKLNCAFLDAESRLHDDIKCPIFLFFSVNGSGQFVGLAEMFGPVDFNKTMNFWQEDLWHGFFPIKWHIVKDLPSYLFKNIILENNEFKAVTASRDTQEVEHHHGLKMLSIFKDFEARTCILDDFDYYEEKERSQKPYRRTAMRQAPMKHYQDHVEPARRKVMSRGPERTAKDRDAAFLAAVTGRLSIQSSRERVRRPMVSNLK